MHAGPGPERRRSALRGEAPRLIGGEPAQSRDIHAQPHPSVAPQRAVLRLQARAVDVQIRKPLPRQCNSKPCRQALVLNHRQRRGVCREGGVDMVRIEGERRAQRQAVTARTGVDLRLREGEGHLVQTLGQIGAPGRIAAQPVGNLPDQSGGRLHGAGGRQGLHSAEPRLAL